LSTPTPGLYFVLEAPKTVGLQAMTYTVLTLLTSKDLKRQSSTIIHNPAIYC